MSSQVASKNLYELLGNDHDEDSDKEPEPPTRAVDKNVPRTSKRNIADPAPRGAGAAPVGGERGGRGGRRGGFTGSEEAFRDRAAGSVSNRGKPTGDGGAQDRQPRGERGDGRGRGRGARGRGTFGDRQSGTYGDTEKKVAQGWGGAKGDSEYADEKAGEAIAKAEEKAEGLDASTDTAVDADGNPIPGAAATKDTAPAAEAEVEDNSMSYADYLAEQAQKKLDLGKLEIRKPNENVKQDKKWAAAKELKKAEEDEEAYIAGAAHKAKRERQRKEKTVIDIDQRFVEPSGGRGGYEGGRGGRGGRGRGEGRGGGDRGGRGGPRGGRGGDFHRGGGDRGGHRGGRGGQVNVQDTKAFPSLGGS